MKFPYPKGLLNKLDFGHFEGLTLLNIYRGIVPISRVVVNGIFESVIHEFKPYEYSYDFDFFLNCDGSFVHMLPKEHSVDDYDSEGDMPNIKNDYEKNFQLMNDFFKKNLSREFIDINQGDNAFVIDLNKVSYYDRKEHKQTAFSIASDYSKSVYKGSPKYIDWCIVNIDSFFISPDTIASLENLSVCVFAGFELEKISNTLYKIIQFQKTYKYKFSEIAIGINEKKYKDFIIKLDKGIERQKWVEKHGDETRKKYTEQDYIDDAFGGEASAYWNVD